MRGRVIAAEAGYEIPLALAQIQDPADGVEEGIGVVAGFTRLQPPVPPLPDPAQQGNVLLAEAAFGSRAQ